MPPGPGQQTERIFRFGSFELSEREGELRKNGVRIKLQEQPFRVLRELVANAGKTVSREELQQKLWLADTFVDFDVGLNTAIRKLRQALNDDADEPRYIETLARRGYRFIAPVTPANGMPGSESPLASRVGAPVALPAAKAEESNPVIEQKAASETRPAIGALRAAQATLPEPPRGNQRKWMLLGAAIAALAIAILFWVSRPPAAPVVEGIYQLTDDGKGKIYTQTDGSRVYFSEDRGGALDIGQVSVDGGPVALLPNTISAPAVTGITPDGSSLLTLQGTTAVPRPVWEVPLPVGDARRIGNLEAHDASVTPDGHLLLCQVADLLIADKDGSNPRKIATLTEGHFGGAEMSPDGRRIVFTRYGEPELYVMNSDGSDMRPLAKSREPGGFCCARWTPDGKYIVFSTRFPVPRQDLWSLRMDSHWPWRVSQPTRLTAGPLSYWMPVPSKDGQKIFAIGTKQRNELFRYDLASKKFVPFSLGTGAFNPTFSSDGAWVAYTTSDGSLWRSRADGTDRLQLTFPPDVVWDTFISPDGKWVSYRQRESTYIIGINGGAPRQVFSSLSGGPNWSPDGKSLIFSAGGKNWQTPDIEMLDVQTGKIAVVPGGQLSPQWAAPGKLIGVRRDWMVLQICDLATQQWSDLTKPVDGPIAAVAHSPDFQYLYYATRGLDPRLVRVRMSDMKSEILTSLKDLQLPYGAAAYTQINIAPDGSPIFTYAVGTQEIYALSVKWP